MPEACRQIAAPDPGPDQRGGRQLRHVDHAWLPRRHAADALPGRRRAPPASSARWTSCSAQASAAIADGHDILILSDRGVDAGARAPSRACSPPRPCTITWCAEGERTRCGLVMETGDAREVHHVCLLIGYGAGAVNPWLAFETLDDMIRQGLLPGVDRAKAVKQLHQGAQQGHPQGDVQDGDLDAAELLRRPDLRGHRAEPRRSSTATSRGPPRAWAASASR